MSYWKEITILIVLVAYFVWLARSVIIDTKKAHKIRSECHQRYLNKVWERRQKLDNFLRKNQ
jgi:hypothetical protein